MLLSAPSRRPPTFERLRRRFAVLARVIEGPGPPIHVASASEYAKIWGHTIIAVSGGASDHIDPEVIAEVEGAQNGNANSFALLYDRYVDKVYAYCYHRVGDPQTAEDLTADVFMRAMKRIDSFQWKGRDFGAWLITIARNRCHDHFKSSRFRLESAVAEIHDATSAKSENGQPERTMELQDLRTQVYDALRRLKSEQAEVLYHRFLQGYDVQTTAEIMGKKSGAIRALQYRALKALAKHVDVEALW